MKVANPAGRPVGFRRQATLQGIAQAFPVLNLEQVYGAITYYLAHRDDVDRYLASRRQDFETARDADRMFSQKLTEAKKQTSLTR